MHLILRHHYRLLLVLGFLPSQCLHSQAVRITDGSVFDKAILPILQERCMSCHGPTKAKGKLKLHTKEDVQAAEGLIVPKDLDESDLVYRIALPLNDPDDERMPPSEEPNQITPDEVWLIKWWVYNGASYDQKLSEIPNDDVGREPLLRVLKHYALHPPGTSALVKPAEAPAHASTPAPGNPPTGSTPPPQTAQQAGTRQWGSLYEEAIDPLLEFNCGKCHGESRASAKLRLNTKEDIQAGGKNGPVFVAGNPKKSLMIERIHLEKGDDSRMPPTEENRQLDSDEISLLEWWIQAGAKYDTPLNSAPGNFIPTIKRIIDESDARKAAMAAGPVNAFSVKEADKDALAEVEKLGVRVVKRAEGSNALAVHCDDMASEIDDKALQTLTAIAPQVAWLNLAKTKVTDQGLNVLEQFQEVRRLHLDRTKISDAAIPQILKLQKLEYLNLYGTQVTDAGITQLVALPALQKVFTTGTQVTQAGIDRLLAGKPGINVVSGLRTLPDEPQPGEVGSVVGATATANAAPPAVDPTPVNTMCPIKPDRQISPSRTTVFNGMTIGLCCGRCQAMFDDNPSAFISKVVITRPPKNVAMAPAAPGAPPQPGAIPPAGVPAPHGKVDFGPRQWTNSQGRSLQGTLLSMSGTTAVLNINGVTYRIPMETLSASDQQYIAQWKQSKGIR